MVIYLLDSDILIGPNDLEIEFRATVSEIKEIHSESFFTLQLQKKHEKGHYIFISWLNMVNTQRPMDRDGLWLLLNGLWSLARGSIQMVWSFMGKFQHFLLIKNECCLTVLHFKGHIGKLCPAFYICIKYAENPFRKGLNKHASLLLGFELGNHVLGYLSGGSYEKDSPVQFKYSSRDLNKRVESVVFCLARCFFYILS